MDQPFRADQRANAERRNLATFHMPGSIHRRHVRTESDLYFP
jgi:hypothetical protein